MTERNSLFPSMASQQSYFINPAKASSPFLNTFSHQMKLTRYPTRVEWEEIEALGPGVRNYRGKKTLFYNGEELRGDDGEHLIYDEEERYSWKVIIVLPGVEVIPVLTFNKCNVKVVIMANSVRRIENEAFNWCRSLEFIKFSTNLGYIGHWAFNGCESLTSIFIPESCRVIGYGAFHGCERLIILNVPQTSELGVSVIARTALIEASTFETNEYGHYLRDTVAVNAWIKSMNDGEGFALHRICSSYNPEMEQVYGYVKDHGVHVMKLPNSIGITPSQYLAANPYSEIEEGKLAKRYVLEMMGEFVQELSLIHI